GFLKGSLFGKFLADNAGGSVDTLDEFEAGRLVYDGAGLITAGKLLASVAGRWKPIRSLPDWRSASRGGGAAGPFGGEEMLTVGEEVKFPLNVDFVDPVRKRQIGLAKPFLKDVLD